MAAPKLSAREIVAYSDAELDRYLEESRRSPCSLCLLLLRRLLIRCLVQARQRPRSTEPTQVLYSEAKVQVFAPFLVGSSNG